MIADLPSSSSVLLAQSLLQQPSWVLHPAAAQLGGDFGETHWANALRASNEQLIPRSLTLALQAPEGAPVDGVPGYPAALLACLRIHAAHLADDREVVAMVLQRGLAECLEPAALGQVIDAVPQSLRIVARPQVEVRLDAGSRRHAAQLRAVGCTRLNVVDLPHADGPALLAQGLREGFTACYYQLRVPDMADTGFLARLDQVLALAPDRIVLPAPSTLPARPDVSAWLGAWQAVRGAGYVPIGGDHYQRGDRLPPLTIAGESRHCDLARVPRRDRSDFLGIGSGGYSQIGDVYCRLEPDFIRWQARLAGGHAGVTCGRVQSETEALASGLMQQIACNHTLDVAEFEWRNAMSFADRFSAALDRLAPIIARGWARWEQDVLRLAPEGALLWRMMAACFRTTRDGS